MLLYIGFIFGVLLKYNHVIAAQGYFGTKIGALSQLHHGVSGDVYAVDSRTLFLKNFNYDGEGPAAYFYVGNSKSPSNVGGLRVRDERGSNEVLRKYRHKDITLSLPEGKTLRDIKWFSVWCDDFSVNFGDVTIPKSLDFPRPQKIGQLSGVHGVSSDNIVIVDAQTLLIPNFSYDGEAPDAKFWIGRGSKPTSSGIRIPDENGKEIPLRRYDKKTIVLTLPGDLTVFDIGHFGVWCEAFTVDFGHVRIPDQINVPPSLKMLGISPQSKLNCEVLYDDLAFEVRWAVAGESVVIQLVAKLEDGEYMSFGVSANPTQSLMIGGDVAVTWVDKSSGKGFAQDYILDSKSQCSGSRGSCPDNRLSDNTNSIRLLNAAMVNGYSIVTYQRPVKATDQFDSPIYTNGSQAIIWGIGPLNQRQEVSYHTSFLKKTKLIDFGRQPVWNCPTPDSENVNTKPMASQPEEEFYEKRPENSQLSSHMYEVHENTNTNAPINRHPPQYSSNDRIDLPERRRPIPKPQSASKNGAWDIPAIQCFEPEDGVFYAQMGPTGGKQGYPAITGHVGWGISWYINGLLIPEINLIRGKTYTFVVEGGNNPEVPAKYHPFYITDDPIGGYEHKSEEEKMNVRIYAGVQKSRNQQLTPIGVGRLCNWTPDQDGPTADEYTSFGAYQRSLSLKCDEGEPGIITWTPDRNTPDIVYYQCFTHRYLGWKINVLDSCDDAQATDLDEVFVDPNEPILAEPSIRHESKIIPNELFLQQHEKDLIKHHNMNSAPPKIQYDLQKNQEITKIISEGIKAAEELEESISNTPVNQFDNQNIGLNREETLTGSITPQFQHQVGDFKNMPNRPILSSSGLPMYLRPPNNVPFMRPMRLPIRRPISLERRPVTRPQRPIILPQPSMIVSHYQKPVSPFLRPFMKQKPLAIKSIASVLLLGEPTEIKPFKKSNDLVIGKPQQSAVVELPPNFNLKKNLPIPTMIDYSQQRNVKKTVNPVVLPQQNFQNRVEKRPNKNEKKPVFKEPYDISSEQSNPLKSTGFRPSSVIVEGGFKPIVRRQDEEIAELEYDEEHEGGFERRSDNFSDIDEAIENEALFINPDESDNVNFEPMFIPSPPDSVAMAQTSVKEKPNKLSGDLKDMLMEDGEDKIAVAAERLDSFYLPPEPKKAENKYPEGSVVTFDGKAVLDTTLLNTVPNTNIPGNHELAGTSKTEQFIRNTPQFGPFKGEIPPISEYVAPDTVSNIKNNINGITHNNNAVQNIPSSVSEYANPLTTNTRSTETKPISTKLSILKNESSNARFRRAASPHHTPDHIGNMSEENHSTHNHQSHASSNTISYGITTHLLILTNIILFKRFW